MRWLADEVELPSLLLRLSDLKPSGGEDMDLGFSGATAAHSEKETGPQATTNFAHVTT